MYIVRFLKDWTLPVAMTIGTVLYLLFGFVPALAPAAATLGPCIDVIFPLSVFATLLVTFAKVDFHLMHLCRWHSAVLGAQLLLIAALTGGIVWAAGQEATSLPPTLLPVATALLTCIIAPCASASPVVTAKLGGDLTAMTTFVLLSAVVTAVLIPAVFPLVHPNTGAENVIHHSSFVASEASLQAERVIRHSSFVTRHSLFLTAFLAILQKMATVLLLPLVLGAAIRMGAHHGVRLLTPIYNKIMQTPDLGFYCWAFSLAITAGVTVRNIVHSGASLGMLIAIALLSFAAAAVQFGIGRAIGHRMQAPIESGQAMFQKNTALAIWVAYMYLSPVASIGAGCYVLWQNIINSIELWQRKTLPPPSLLGRERNGDSR